MTWFSTSLFLTAVYLVVTANFAVSQQSNCPTDYVFLADKCYSFRRTVQPWDNARTSCLNEDADLASVLTTEEYTQILDHVANNYPGVYWIGGATRNRGAWTWVNSGASMNENWWGGAHAPTPSRCAYFCSHTRKYWSSTCGVNKNYICEKNPETESEPAEEVEVEEIEGDDETLILPVVHAELRSEGSIPARNMVLVVFLLSLCAAMV
ncbi:snaclec anticoagulant protein subunit B-like [Penaeus japonicus]|uniref:snaclec anticoagulant protein subunit B-like n=1 Tax=Penaeus japonicus TaxID=27405 RepID=UPI001C713256|nr:snaclec anticoagulant protein subunit B-like [Penaeus japonicus]